TTQLAALPASPDGTLDAAQRVLVLQQGDLREKIDKTQVSGGARSAGGFSLGPASGPAGPVSPTPVLSAILAALAGGLVGLLTVAVLEVLDDTISGAGDVGPAARRLPCLAEVPRANKVEAVSLDHPTHPAAEAFRSVRTGLPFVTTGGVPRVIHITSANPGEYKTTTAVNLAVTFAATGRRVCLVSCDLRRPRLEAVLGVANTEGFTSVILGAARLGEVLVAVQRQSHLYLLPTGPIPPNPAEVIKSSMAHTIFARLRAEFDVVVIDSAPVLPVTDAAVLSGQADLTILVVAAGRTTRADLDRAVEILDQVSAPIGALVINHPARDRWLVRAKAPERMSAHLS
ncbi:MAG: polysaccharide biosynthesis tyrosine autokinase, partial [Acidimicrobiales bacterium]